MMSSSHRMHADGSLQTCAYVRVHCLHAMDAPQVLSGKRFRDNDILLRLRSWLHTCQKKGKKTHPERKAGPRVLWPHLQPASGSCRVNSFFFLEEIIDSYESIVDQLVVRVRRWVDGFKSEWIRFGSIKSYERGFSEISLPT